jgi:hypothetical protein
LWGRGCCVWEVGMEVRYLVIEEGGNQRTNSRFFWKESLQSGQCTGVERGARRHRETRRWHMAKEMLDQGETRI